MRIVVDTHPSPDATGQGGARAIFTRGTASVISLFLEI